MASSEWLTISVQLVFSCCRPDGFRSRMLGCGLARSAVPVADDGLGRLLCFALSFRKVMLVDGRGGLGFRLLDSRMLCRPPPMIGLGP